MTVGTLLATTSSRELAEWEAHFSLKAERDMEEDLMRKAQGNLAARIAARRGRR